MLLVLLALACGSPQNQSQTTKSPVPAPVSDAADIPSAPAMPGLITEEQFKAAHKLKGEQAPAPRGETVQVGGMAAYLSMPKGEPKAGILVIHEWWGLNNNIRHWSDRLAEDGYVALAVDLYGGTVATTPDEAMAAMKTVDEAAATDKLKAAHALLQKKAPKTASIGWCFGGGWSLRAAIDLNDLDAAVMYYGRPETDSTRLSKIKAPVLGIFGNRDQGIPPKAVDDFEAAMKDLGKSIEIHRYDADHAFANPSNDRYAEEAAGQAWEKTRAFLTTTLDADKPASNP